MHWIYVSTFFVLCLNLQPLHAYVEEAIKGSLSGSWNMTFEVYMKRFEETILQSVDYERNVFSVKIIRNKTEGKQLFIRYNKKHIYKLSKICNCNDCDEITSNFIIVSNNKTIELRCNYGEVVRIKKYNKKNRTKIKLSKDLMELTSRPNTIIIMMNLNQTGCIQLFHANGELMHFKNPLEKYTASCPRQCPSGICNRGRCRALYKSGPICDCSSTVLNGQFCNDDLKPYVKEEAISYSLLEVDNYVFFKISWRKNYGSRLCLLEFVTGNRNVTLSIDGVHLLDGDQEFGNITTNTNFLSITKLKKRLIIKVNNHQIIGRTLFVGNTLINVGFTTDERESCSTFNGEYDIDFRNYSLSEVRFDKIKKIKNQPPKSGILKKTPYRILIIICGSVATLCLLAFAINIIRCILCRTPTIIKKSLPYNKKEKHDVDLDSNYDSLEFTKDDKDSNF